MNNLLRVKKKFTSWQDGRNVMTTISKNINLEVVEVEEYLRCENDNISVSCHLSPEGHAFILAKSSDKKLLGKIEKILQL